MKIAISGKGGCGKSTVTVLLSKAFSEMGFKVTIFDVDESNMGLARMLGFEDDGRPIIDLYGGKKGFKEALNKGHEISLNIDLIAMRRGNIKLVRAGKIERGGEGCACLIGILAKEVLSKIKAEDEIVLVDTDAGIEHLGRGVDQAVDAILFIVDPTYDSILLADKANKMAADLGISKFMVVLNKVDEEIASLLSSKLSSLGIRVIGKIRHDPEVMRSMLVGEAIKTGIAMDDAMKLARTIVEELGYGSNR